MWMILYILACAFEQNSIDWKDRDIDQDGWSIADGDCWESSSQPTLVLGAQSHRLSSADIHPGAFDVPYDGVDANCDGLDDFDADQDGFVPNEYEGIATLQLLGSGRLPVGDCWDWTGDVLLEEWTVVVGFSQPTAEMVYPNATEVYYDGIDQNCDGLNDFDADQDGFVAAEDCDESNPNIPTTEIPVDGIDQDCDGQEWCFWDQDGDGFGQEELILSNDWTCSSEGLSVDSQDCDDSDASIYPTAPELCDGLLNDCAMSELSAVEQDRDGDGYVSCVIEGLWQGDESIVGGQDCDDDNADYFPDQLWYWDGDGDGFASDLAAYLIDCSPNGNYQSQQLGDCEDSDAFIYPLAMENWNDIDENCDGLEDVGIFCQGDYFGTDYFLICENPMSQSQANSHCLNGGYDGLIAIHHLSEQYFLQQYFQSSQYWMGLSDRLVEGVFRWSDGFAYHSFGNWAVNEPNNGWFLLNGSLQSFGEEDCVILDDQGQWFDVGCSNPNAFICQKRL